MEQLTAVTSPGFVDLAGNWADLDASEKSKWTPAPSKETIQTPVLLACNSEETIDQLTWMNMSWNEVLPLQNLGPGQLHVF